MFNLLLNKTLIPSKTRVVSVGSLLHTQASALMGPGYDITGMDAALTGGFAKFLMGVCPKEIR